MSGEVSWISIHLIALIELLHAYNCYYFNYLFVHVRLLFEQIFLNSCFKSCLLLKAKLIVSKFKTGQLFCFYEETLVETFV